MNLFAALLRLNKQKKSVRKTIKEYKEEVLLKQGREQFQKLLKLGQMPVAFL